MNIFSGTALRESLSNAAESTKKRTKALVQKVWLRCNELKVIHVGVDSLEKQESKKRREFPDARILEYMRRSPGRVAIYKPNDLGSLVDDKPVDVIKVEGRMARFLSFLTRKEICKIDSIGRKTYPSSYTISDAPES